MDKFCQRQLVERTKEELLIELQLARNELAKAQQIIIDQQNWIDRDIEKDPPYLPTKL